jgi:nucleoside-diphosphate-sugar epimerase
MRILVTGGSGFLGKQLVQSLLKSAHEVINIDLIESGINHINFIEKILNINDLKDTFGVDIIIHCAAIVPSAKNNNAIVNSNITGTDRLLKLALKNKTKKFIFISSSAVYGIPDSNPVTLRNVMNPVENYGKSKLQAENLCLAYRQKGLAISILRPRTIIGNYRSGLFGTLFEWVSQGRRIPVIAGGLNKYQFIDVEDFVDLIIKIIYLQKDIIINAGALDSPAIKDSLTQLCQHAKTGANVYSIPRILLLLTSLLSKIHILPFAPYQLNLYSKSFWFDSKELYKIIQWEPKYSSAQAMIRAYQTFLETKNLGSVNIQSLHSKPLESFILKIFSKFL